MLILGIESSCDDTSVALLDCSDKGCFAASEKTASQIDIHKKYGGVVPEIAGRAHAEKIVPLIEEVLGGTDNGNSLMTQSWKEGERANTPRRPPARGDFRPDVIAVTSGPGLITGLIVGVEAARTLSYALGIPLIGVNHIEGHIHSVEIKNQKSKIKNLESLRDDYSINYPALALIASGGHTELILIKKQGQYKILGKTKDDAAGECFDKVAKLLGLPYPGGPQISKLAATGNSEAINFPRPMIRDDNFDFSFAGLKTSALYWLRDNVIASEAKQSHGNQKIKKIAAPAFAGVNYPRNDIITINDFCASFEQAIIDVLVAKTIKAAKKYNHKTVILCGGVSANKKLQTTLKQAAANHSLISDIRYPTSAYCMDNAAMIAVAGYYKALKNNFTDWRKIKADPNWEIA